VIKGYLITALWAAHHFPKYSTSENALKV
jgi:hypothetical protein